MADSAAIVGGSTKPPVSPMVTQLKLPSVGSAVTADGANAKPESLEVVAGPQASALVGGGSIPVTRSSQPEQDDGRMASSQIRPGVQRGKTTPRSPGPLGYLYGESRPRGRRPVWESPRPVRPGGPGGKYAEGQVRIFDMSQDDAAVYCADLEATVERLQRDNASLAASADIARAGDIQLLSDELQRRQAIVKELHGEVGRLKRENAALVSEQTRGEVTRKSLAQELATARGCIRANETASKEEVGRQEDANARLEVSRIKLAQELQSRERDLTGVRAALLQRDRQVRALDDQIVDARLAQAEAESALAQQRTKVNRTVQKAGDEFASSQAELTASLAATRGRLAQSAAECEELATHLRLMGLEKMSLIRQFKELQARNQRALDMAYEELAARQKRMQDRLAEYETENDELCGHLEALEISVIKDPQLLSSKYCKQEVVGTHAQLLRGRRDREVYTRSVEEALLRLRCENEMLKGRVLVAENEFMELARWQRQHTPQRSRGRGALRGAAGSKGAVSKMGTTASLAGAYKMQQSYVSSQVGPEKLGASDQPLALTTTAPVAVSTRDEREAGQTSWAALEKRLHGLEAELSATKRQAVRTASRLKAAKQDSVDKVIALQARVVPLLSKAGLAADPEMPFDDILTSAATLVGLDIERDYPAMDDEGPRDDGRGAEHPLEDGGSSSDTNFRCGTKIGGRLFRVDAQRDDERQGFEFSARDHDTLESAQVFVSDHYATYILRDQCELLEPGRTQDKLRALVGKLEIVEEESSEGKLELGFPEDSHTDGIQDSEAKRPSDASSSASSAQSETPTTDAQSKEMDDGDGDLGFMPGRRKRRKSIFNPVQAAVEHEAGAASAGAVVKETEKPEGGGDAELGKCASAQARKVSEHPPMSKKDARFIRTITRQDTFSRGQLSGAAPANPMQAATDGAPTKEKKKPPSRFAPSSPTKAPPGPAVPGPAVVSSGTKMDEGATKSEDDFSVPRPRKRRGSRATKSKRSQSKNAASAGSAESSSGSSIIPKAKAEAKKRLQSSNKDAEMARLLETGTQAEELARLKRSTASNPYSEQQPAKKKAEIKFNPLPLQRQDTFGTAPPPSKGKRSPGSSFLGRPKARSDAESMAPTSSPSSPTAAMGKPPSQSEVSQAAAPAVGAQQRKLMSGQHTQRQDTMGSIAQLRRPKVDARAFKPGDAAKPGRETAEPRAAGSPLIPTPSGGASALQKKIVGASPPIQRGDTFGASTKLQRPEKDQGATTEREAPPQPVRPKAPRPVKPGPKHFTKNPGGVQRQDTFGSIKRLVRPKLGLPPPSPMR